MQHLRTKMCMKRKTWTNRIPGMPMITMMPRKKRHTKTIAAPMRLSSQILVRRRSPSENEEPSRRATRRTRRRRRRRRRRRPRRGDEEKNAEYLPATGTSEIKRNVTIGAGQEAQETLPQAARVKTYLCRWRAVSISNTCTQSRVGDEKNPTSIRIGELDIPATHDLVIPTVT